TSGSKHRHLRLRAPCACFALARPRPTGPTPLHRVISISWFPPYIRRQAHTNRPADLAVITRQRDASGAAEVAGDPDLAGDPPVDPELVEGPDDSRRVVGIA